jgi:hypothetical protein
VAHESVVSFCFVSTRFSLQCAVLTHSRHNHHHTSPTSTFKVAQVWQVRVVDGDLPLRGSLVNDASKRIGLSQQDSPRVTHGTCVADWPSIEAATEDRPAVSPSSSCYRPAAVNHGPTMDQHDIARRATPTTSSPPLRQRRERRRRQPRVPTEFWRPSPSAECR